MNKANFTKAISVPLKEKTPFESQLGLKVILTEKGERLERLRRMRGYSTDKIAAIICANNIHLLDEPEIIELLWMWDRDRRELKDYRDKLRKNQ